MRTRRGVPVMKRKLFQVIRALRNGMIFTQKDIEGGITWMSANGSASGTGTMGSVNQSYHLLAESAEGLGQRFITGFTRGLGVGMEKHVRPLRATRTLRYSV